MAFIADYAAKRTYDPERGLELRGGMGGGADGSHDFRIHPIGKPDEHLAGFTAYLEPRPATEEERVQYPGIIEVATWRIATGWGPNGRVIPGYTMEQSKEIMREALRTYRFVHGKSSNVTLYDAI